MTYYFIMGAITVIAAGISAFFFRKGGVYNPVDLSQDPVSPNEIAPTTAPKKPVQANSAPSSPISALDTFCTAIRDFEGKPGDANYRNNNPGNCRYNSNGYLPKYGDVKESPAGFAIFPTYEQGWEYLQALVKQMAKNHPTWSFLDFFQVYAPPSDNNPTTRYATFVATHCGVPVDTEVAKYLGVV